MEKKAISGIMLALLMIAASTSVFNFYLVKASPGTIYIRADGSIDPPTAPISSVDSITYTFTGNIYDEIVVERSNIIVDGNKYTLQGSGIGNGFYLSGINNVTIQNTNITNFRHGIFLYSSNSSYVYGNNITNNAAGVYLNSSSSYNAISRNNITNNQASVASLSCDNNTISENNIKKGVVWLRYSSNNTIRRNNITNTKYWGILIFDNSSENIVTGNNITNNHIGVAVSFSNYSTVSRNYVGNNNDTGIVLFSSNYSTVTGNIITNNLAGIWLDSSNYSTVSRNYVGNNNDTGIVLTLSNYSTVTENDIWNNYYGIWLYSSSDNKFYHNNLISNTVQVNITTPGYANSWDDGYPSGGNYWSDYGGVDVMSGANQDLPGSDGIGDTPYTLDADNVDHYPLMDPYGSPTPQTYSLKITTTVGGTTSPVPGTYSYTNGAEVTVTAIPDTNYVFSHWELDGSLRYSNPISVTMDSDHTLHAVFEYSPPPPVGGIVSPVDKFGLLAPYIALAIAVVVITIGAVYARKRWLGKAVVRTP